MTEAKKRCPICTRDRALDEFARNPSRTDGRDGYCKPCKAERAREYSAKHREKNAPEPVDPLKAAQQRHAERVATSSLKAEHAALLEENKRLKWSLEVAAHMNANARAAEIHRAVPTKGEAVACMIASDWHVEEPVQADKVHGLNEFDLAIAEKRAHAFFANGLRLAEIMAREVKIETLFLGLLGDFFSGHIHEELRESNLLAPGEAAHFVLNTLASGIEFLIRESKFQIEIDALPGNHGRMTVKPRIQNATETSLETFMFHSLAFRFAGNPRVNFRVANSKIVYRRFFERFNMRLLHGDDVKFGGGVGGVTIPIRKKLAPWDKAIRADLTVMGHFHQLLDGGDFIVNGSLIGYNEFAQAIGASPEEARQAFFLIHNRNGGEKSITAPIWLDRAHGR
jgi:hypothetical protein